MAEPWKAPKQEACEPGCTCDLNPAPAPAPVIEAPEPRTCTPEDPCSFCGPVERFWASDPAPVEAPPEPITPEQEAQLARAGLEGAAAGRHISAAFRLIRNSTRRNT